MFCFRFVLFFKFILICFFRFSVLLTKLHQRFAGPTAQGVSDPVSYDHVIVGSCDHTSDHGIMRSWGFYDPSARERGAAPGGSVAVFTAGDLPGISPPPGVNLPPHKKNAPKTTLLFERLLARQMLPKASQNDPQNH